MFLVNRVIFYIKLNGIFNFFDIDRNDCLVIFKIFVDIYFFYFSNKNKI